MIFQILFGLMVSLMKSCLEFMSCLLSPVQ